ncbi:MAG: hypothetical protein OXG10_02335 [Candidatus Dadabacteria bacterium]|nr:hypothetical protein [Candidatus Dadabacteria bacterium]
MLWDKDSGQHQYIVSVDVKREDLIERVTELKKAISDGVPHTLESDNFKVFADSRHLYEPLIYIGEKVDYIKVKPVALNEGEKHFVESLTKYAQQHEHFFRDKEMYLLRNQSRGIGFGFFNEGGFYPDFIL